MRNYDIFKRRKGAAHRVFCGFLAFTLFFSWALPPGYAQVISTVLNLPAPGTMVPPSAAFVPVLLKGMTIHPENPLQFDFIIDTGNSGLAAGTGRDLSLQKESERLVKYFLASMTIPKDDLWVNLSPYESDKIIPEELGKTELGRDMLAQDYILKQLTASLMYPEKELGKEFWDKVYKKAQEKFGTTEISVDTFNKVWILPETATVYEHGQTVYIVEAKLRVMLDSDYVAQKLDPRSSILDSRDSSSIKHPESSIETEIVREIILPEIEKEVNEGQNFAPLRQIYHSLILAKWYKETIKNSLLSKVYVDQKKIAGVNIDDATLKDQIYAQYMEAYKKGVFNYIKEDYDRLSNEIIPRKYFSGGIKGDVAIDRSGNLENIEEPTNAFRLAMRIDPQKKGKSSSPIAVELSDNDFVFERSIDNAINVDNWRQYFVDKNIGENAEATYRLVRPDGTSKGITKNQYLRSILKRKSNGVEIENFYQEELKNRYYDADVLESKVEELLATNEIGKEALDSGNSGHRGNAIETVKKIEELAKTLDAQSVERRLSIARILKTEVVPTNENKGFIDLHHHSFRSDGAHAPTRVVYDAWKSGMRTIAVSDHNTFEHFAEALATGKIFGIEVFPAVEFDASVELKDRNGEISVSDLQTQGTSEEDDHIEYMHVLAYFPATEDAGEWLVRLQGTPFYQKTKERFYWNNAKQEIIRQRFNRSVRAKAERLEITLKDVAQYGTDFSNWSQFGIFLQRKYPGTLGQKALSEIKKNYLGDTNIVEGGEKGGPRRKADAVQFSNNGRYGQNLGYIIEQTRALGGVVVLAHPIEDRNAIIKGKDRLKKDSNKQAQDEAGQQVFGSDNEKKDFITKKEAELNRKGKEAIVDRVIVAVLSRFDFDGVEVYIAKHSPEKRRHYSDLVGQINNFRSAKGKEVLLETVSTDAHNSPAEEEGGIEIGIGKISKEFLLGNLKEEQENLRSKGDYQELIRQIKDRAASRIHSSQRSSSPVMDGIRNRVQGTEDVLQKVLDGLRDVPASLIGALEEKDQILSVKAGKISDIGFGDYWSQIQGFAAEHSQILTISGLMAAGITITGLYYFWSRYTVSGNLYRLQSSNSYVRRDAAEALGGLGDTRAVEPLIQMLKDSDLAVHLSAAGALRELGATKEQMIDGYLKALKSSDSYVRRVAAEALGGLGDTRAVEPLKALLSITPITLEYEEYGPYGESWTRTEDNPEYSAIATALQELRAKADGASSSPLKSRELNKGIAEKILKEGKINLADIKDERLKKFLVFLRENNLTDIVVMGGAVKSILFDEEVADIDISVKAVLTDGERAAFAPLAAAANERVHKNSLESITQLAKTMGIDASAFLPPSRGVTKAFEGLNMDYFGPIQTDRGVVVKRSLFDTVTRKGYFTNTAAGVLRFAIDAQGNIYGDTSALQDLLQGKLTIQGDGTNFGINDVLRVLRLKHQYGLQISEEDDHLLKVAVSRYRNQSLPPIVLEVARDQIRKLLADTIDRGAAEQELEALGISALVEESQSSSSATPQKATIKGSEITNDDEVGGIDMNDIDVDRQGTGVDIQFDPVELQELIGSGIDGFAPVIINIVPLPSVLPLLGLEPGKKEEGDPEDLGYNVGVGWIEHKEQFKMREQQEAMIWN